MYSGFSRLAIYFSLTAIHDVRFQWALWTFWRALTSFRIIMSLTTWPETSAIYVTVPVGNGFSVGKLSVKGVNKLFMPRHTVWSAVGSWGVPSCMLTYCKKFISWLDEDWEQKAAALVYYSNTAAWVYSLVWTLQSDLHGRWRGAGAEGGGGADLWL